jgi:hypothetical protein
MSMNKGDFNEAMLGLGILSALVNEGKKDGGNPSNDTKGILDELLKGGNGSSGLFDEDDKKELADQLNEVAGIADVAVKPMLNMLNNIFETINADERFFKNVAKMAKNFADAFIAEGFTNEEAMSMCAGIMTTVSKAANSSSNKKK